MGCWKMCKLVTVDNDTNNLLKYLFFNFTLHVNNLTEKNRIIHRHCCLDCGNIGFKA